MGVKTTHINSREKYQQRTVLSTDNGLPVSGRVEIQASHEIFSLTQQVLSSYSNPTVSVPNTYNLNMLLIHRSKYTGQFILIDASGDTYYIERSSIDTINNTMDIFFDNTFTGSPASINLDAGWIIAEAKLVNHLAVSTAAHIDSVVFNGIDINVDLDGSTDSVSIVDSDGDALNINPDGSLNVVADTELDASDGDNVAISGHQFPVRQIEEKVILQAGLNVNSFTQVFTYTSVDADLNVHKLTSYADTYGTWRVKIDGTTIDYFSTSPTERNCRFQWSEDEDLPTGGVITIEFRPDRNKLTQYTFFWRIEGYNQP